MPKELVALRREILNWLCIASAYGENSSDLRITSHYPVSNEFLGSAFAQPPFELYKGQGGCQGHRPPTYQNPSLGSTRNDALLLWRLGHLASVTVQIERDNHVPMRWTGIWHHFASAIHFPFFTFHLRQALHLHMLRLLLSAFRGHLPYPVLHFFP